MELDLNLEDLERCLRENKSMAEMFAEHLVMQAASPGLTKQRALELRIRRDICLPVCDVISSNKAEQIAEAAYAMALALSLMSLTCKTPDVIIDTICAHAKEKAAQAAGCHGRMMALGITIGTKLGMPIE
jgi:hypothetical protein